MADSKFIQDYCDAIIDISSNNYPPDYDLGQFFTQWCNELKNRLVHYKFDIKIAYKAVFYPEGATPKPSETDYHLYSYDSLAVFTNKKAIIEKEGVEIAERFDKTTNMLLHIIKQQTNAKKLNILSDKYAERLKEMDSMRRLIC